MVMSPKSLLRLPACVSDVTELGPGTQFKTIITDDMTASAVKKVKRVILCSGKVYYDLKEAMDKNAVEGIAIIRIEQLYPLDQNELDKILKPFADVEKIWLQEEPANMGSWTYIQSLLPHYNLRLISRKIAASPATGYKKLHDENQARIVAEATSFS